MSAAANYGIHLLATFSVAALLAGGLIAPPPASATGPGQPVLRAAQSALLPAAAGPRITTDPTDATISRYGTRTSTTFKVKASGSLLKYTWQHRSAAGGSWKNIAGAKSAKYTARASKWASGTRFRVVITGRGGKAVSATAKLTVLHPTKSPAADAEAAFGLTDLTQGVDLSSWQYTPSGRVKVKAIASWAGIDGFTILRAGSGARPIKVTYTDACTNKSAKTGSKPVVKDCAYPVLSNAVNSAGLAQGNYWFNGWISSIDTTKSHLFAGGYTPAASAAQFVAWLKADGHYTKASTDPLVLDIEAGHAWTKTSKGKSYKVSLRAWKPAEAAEFLNTTKQLLTDQGYQANLYVYMSANATAKTSNGAYVWADVAAVARLWVASWGTNNGRIPASQPLVGPWVDNGGWSIWQYTSNARITGDGVGALDADIAKADAWTPAPLVIG
jgi:hypothetical protein